LAECFVKVEKRNSFYLRIEGEKAKDYERIYICFKTAGNIGKTI